MLSKILFSVLLLSCVYTYMLKSIKDNNNINFQKLPDNLNFIKKGTQTVKPNLKEAISLFMVKVFLRQIFGRFFVKKLDKYKYGLKE